MKVHIHGAGQEVGRSCIEITWHDRRILLDCGIKINPEQNEYPTPVDNPEEIDAVFLSHAHLDHTGALPLLFHEGLNCPIFCTQVTQELSNLMLKDSWKIDRIENRQKLYSKQCIRDVLKKMQFNQKGFYKGIEFKLIPSGHIPGSVSIFLKYKNETLLYTGDINGTTTRLLQKNRILPHADVLITEATYGNRQHPERRTVEKKFTGIIQDTLQRGGSPLIGVFAIARSQEIILLLNEIRPKCPIYLDGMSKATTKIFLRHLHDLKNEELRKAVRRIDMVTNWERRKKITKQQGIFIATSGMLDGGPILGYLKDLGQQIENSLILTGYQADGTNGRMLLEHGYIMMDNKPFDITCPVHHLDFSAHADEMSLHEYIKKVEPTVVIAQHGEAGSAKSVAAYARSKGMQAHAPKTGEQIEVKL
ncbi:MAG: MBL fold metallo-hydrolase [Nanoarchaeota archaeon]